MRKLIFLFIVMILFGSMPLAAQEKAPATAILEEATKEEVVVTETLLPPGVSPAAETAPVTQPAPSPPAAVQPMAAQAPAAAKEVLQPAQPPSQQSAAGAGQPARATAATTSTMPAGPRYIIGPGDIIEASVWKDEALKSQMIVLPDGTISFPLVGEFTAGGRTLPELKQEMIEKLSTYVQDTVLSMEVKQVNSMLIYVIGRVNQPNRFIINTNITVLQGLAMAGGLNPFAKRDKIKVFRQEGDKTKIFPFRYDDVVEGKRLEENITLKKGDVIVVP